MSNTQKSKGYTRIIQDNFCYRLRKGYKNCKFCGEFIKLIKIKNKWQPMNKDDSIHRCKYEAYYSRK